MTNENADRANAQNGIENAACIWDQWRGHLAPKLDMLLYTGFWFGTSNPLDKVYGFLGLWQARAVHEIASTPEHLLLLTPDYRKPSAEVYANASRAVVLVSAGLGILDVTDDCRVDAEYAGYPS